MTHEADEPLHDVVRGVPSAGGEVYKKQGRCCGQLAWLPCIQGGSAAGLQVGPGLRHGLQATCCVMHPEVGHCMMHCPHLEGGGGGGGQALLHATEGGTGLTSRCT